MSLRLEIVAHDVQLGPLGYRRLYDFRGSPGAVLIQQVQTEVDFFAGPEPLLSYRGDYAEYFRLGLAGGLDRLGLDEHAFDLRQDGWEQATVRRLLHELGARDPDGRRLTFRESPRLEVRKRFRLSAGIVEGTQAWAVTPTGAEFGFLAQGPRGAPSASLTAFLPGQAPLSSSKLDPLPAGQAAGRGHLAADEAWEVLETFAFEFATLQRRYDDAPGYAAIRLRDEDP